MGRMQVKEEFALQRTPDLQYSGYLIILLSSAPCG